MTDQTINQTQLSSLYVIVQINSSAPQMTKRSRKGTKAAEEGTGAHGAGKYTLDLYPEHLIKPINNAVQLTRNTLASRSAMLGRSLAVLPNQFRAWWAAEAWPMCKNEYDLAVRAAGVNYGMVLSRIQAQQGTMADEYTYPDVSEWLNQFELNWRVLPGADPSLLALDEIGKTYAQQCETDLTNAMMDGVVNTVRELGKHLSNMADKLKRRLADENLGRNAPRFHDSLTENIERLLEVIPALNFTNDPRVDSVVQDVRAQLRVPIEVLKSGTPAVHQQIVNDVDAVLAKMKNFGF